MSYWTLFKRGFRSFPFLVSIATFTFNAGIFTYVSLIKHERISLNVITISVFAFACAFLGWGIASVIKADICRKSILSIPHFKKRVADFYIFFGALLIVILSLFAFPNFSSFLGFGLTAYGFSLFISHLIPYWIVFAWLLMQVPRIFNLHPPAHFGLPGAIPFFLTGSVLILLYRRSMVGITEESPFFRAFPYPDRFNIRGLLRQTKAFYSRKNFWTNGYRFTFEFFLNLLCRLKSPKAARILILSTLRNHITWLSFLAIIYLLIISVFLKPFIPLYLIFFPGVIVWGASIYRGRHLQVDAVRPVTKRRLFLTEYAGNYLAVMAIMLVFLAATRTPDTIDISRKLFSDPPPWGLGKPLLSYISGGLFLASLLLLISRFRIFGSYLPFILSIGIVVGIIEFCTRIVGWMSLSSVLFALTLLLSLISFKLDLEKDIV